MKHIQFIVAALCSTPCAALASTWYIDNAATGAMTGTSWADAWTSVASISGVQAGDTVYVSGGPSGGSRTYALSDEWTLVSGTSGHPTTYQIGQDAEHNGTATFTGSSNVFGPAWQTWAHIIFSGDAGDGQMHFAMSGFDAILYETLTDVRFSYINFGNMGGSYSGTAFGGSDVNGLEFDHNYIYMNGASTDSVMRVDFGGTGYDQNRIHHNVMYAPSDPASPAMGADGLQMSGDGFSIYHNDIINYRWSGWDIATGQHSDGWQTGGGTYIKLYDNLIYGFGDIGIYGGCWGNAVSGGSHVFSHVRIYNNIVDSYDQTVAGSIVAAADDPTGSTFDDIVIANNISRDPPYGSESAGYYGTAIGVGSESAGGTWTNIYVTNNLMIGPKEYNSLSLNSSNATAAHNVWVTDPQLAPLLVDFQPTAATSDYHYTAAATSLIDQGQDLSTDFNTDQDGVARPQGAAWDIGAYEYCTGSDCVAAPDAGTGGSAGQGGHGGHPAGGGMVGAGLPAEDGPGASENDSGCGCCVVGGSGSSTRNAGALAFAIAMALRRRATRRLCRRT